MLTEGAKPGTPHITPRKIYPDGIDLFIEVKSSSKFYDQIINITLVACSLLWILSYHSHLPCRHNHIHHQYTQVKRVKMSTSASKQSLLKWCSFHFTVSQKIYFWVIDCQQKMKKFIFWRFWILQWILQSTCVAKQQTALLLMREFSPLSLQPYWEPVDPPTFKPFFTRPAWNKKKKKVIFAVFLQNFPLRSHRQRCSFALRDSRWINKIETINITFYLLILDLEIGFTLCSICFLGWDKRNQQNMAARGLPKKLQTWYGFLYDNDDDDDDIDD